MYECNYVKGIECPRCIFQKEKNDNLKVIFGKIFDSQLRIMFG